MIPFKNTEIVIATNIIQIVPKLNFNKGEGVGSELRAQIARYISSAAGKTSGERTFFILYA